MKTLHKQVKALNYEALLNVNGGYMGVSGGNICSFQPARSTSSDYRNNSGSESYGYVRCYTINGVTITRTEGLHTDSSYVVTSSGGNGYCDNYSLICGWAR